MKKLVLTLVMGVFLLSTLLYTTNINAVNYQEDCDQMHGEVYQFAQYNGSNGETSQQLADNYWMNCVNNGGSSQVLESLPLLLN